LKTDYFTKQNLYDKEPDIFKGVDYDKRAVVYRKKSIE